MTDNKRQSYLNTLLAFDAATCAIMGVLLVFAFDLISRLTEIPGPFLFVAGLLLLPTALFMAVFARAATVPVWAVQLIVAGNLLWVLGSVILPIAGVITTNGMGWAFLLVQAVAVAVFASLEWFARPRTTRIA